MQIKNNAQQTILYLLDLIVLILGLVALSFALYITPHLLFGMQYNVPAFVMQASEFLRLHHDITGFALIFTILAPFYLAAALLFFISGRLTMEYEAESHQIDLSDLNAETKNLTTKKYKINPAIFYLFLVLITVAFLLFVEWLITRTY